MKPKIYADWCNIFDKIETWEIGHIDEVLLSDMEKGTIDWVDGVSQRITLRLIVLVNKRLQNLCNFYNKRIAMLYNPFDLTNLLIIFRKELIFLKRLNDLPILPEDTRKGLVEDIINYAKKVQQSLEDNAKNDLSGELKRVINSYRIDNI